jgi:hypothetical protein
MPLPAETHNSIHQLFVDIVIAVDDVYEGWQTQDRAKANGNKKNDSMEVDNGPKPISIPSTPRIVLATFTHLSIGILCVCCFGICSFITSIFTNSFIVHLV